MDNIGYTTLTRQSGLLRDMATVAQNMANMATTGYRGERVIFAEHVHALDGAGPSVSMGNGAVRMTDLTQGTTFRTGGSFDLAIEGDGFFLVQTPEGDRLTRAGAFLTSPEGVLVAPDGATLLDAGGAPIFVDPAARAIAIAADGTVSADGNPVAQIGLYVPDDPMQMTRAEGVRFDPVVPVPLEDGSMMQGFLEKSNVDPVSQIARMIEVQRAYELGQTFLDREDERVRQVIRTTGQ
ncbi:MAG: flagellar hook-basal body complex protein [Pseudomonadota bacterium]